MKTLLLLRHAKAENAAPGASDINRSLNERGKKEAQAIGTFIRKQNLSVELVLSSPAVRARQTAELVLSAAEIKLNVGYDQRIYDKTRPTFGSDFGSRRQQECSAFGGA